MTRKTSIPSEAGIISKMVYLYSSHDLEATTCDLAAPRAVPGVELVPYRAIRGSPFKVLATHHGPAGPSGSGTGPFPSRGRRHAPLLTYLQSHQHPQTHSIILTSSSRLPLLLIDVSSIIKYVHSFPSPSPHYPCRHHAFRPIKATPSCTRSPTARATDSDRSRPWGR